MDVTDRLGRVLDLVTRTLDSAEDPKRSVSTITRRAVRIARLRNDYSNLLWLQFELLSMHEKDGRLRLAAEVAPHIPQEEYDHLRAHTLRAFMEERKTQSPWKTIGDKRHSDDSGILAMSIDEIEARREMWIGLRDKDSPTSGLHPVDAYYVERDRSQAKLIAAAAVQDTEAILSRIRNRVHDYLSNVERDLIDGRFQSDVFERNRRYVTRRLSEVVPEIAEQMKSATARLEDSTPESYSQALGTCRRALKAIADYVYPPDNRQVHGPDGVLREMSDDKYIARLWQFAYEAFGDTAGGRLVLAQLNDVGRRIDTIYDMASKGVHSAVDRVEADRCVVQTYLLLGEILRIRDGQMANPDDDLNARSQDPTI